MKLNKLLILTGPQGSGNHLWSKIFGRHKFVNGWKIKSYWEGHHEEPFSHWWEDPNLIGDTQAQYNFTSISCPYVRNNKPHIPKYEEFIEKAKEFFDIRVVVIGRDQTILKTQQERVRGMHTTPLFKNVIKQLLNPHFISMELLYLYQDDYLKRLSEELDFPIDTDCSDLYDEHSWGEMYDTNQKYIQTIGQQPLDLEVKKACEAS
jgi:hypothetical protein